MMQNKTLFLRIGWIPNIWNYNSYYISKHDSIRIIALIDVIAPLEGVHPYHNCHKIIAPYNFGLVCHDVWFSVRRKSGMIQTSLSCWHSTIIFHMVNANHVMTSPHTPLLTLSSLSTTSSTTATPRNVRTRICRITIQIIRITRLPPHIDPRDAVRMRSDTIAMTT